MIARCIALGLPIAWVPIRTIYDGEPSHIQPWQPLHELPAGDAATRAGSCAGGGAMTSAGYAAVTARPDGRRRRDRGSRTVRPGDLGAIAPDIAVMVVAWRSGCLVVALLEQVAAFDNGSSAFLLAVVGGGGRARDRSGDRDGHRRRSLSYDFLFIEPLLTLHRARPRGVAEPAPPPGRRHRRGPACRDASVTGPWRRSKASARRRRCSTSASRWRPNATRRRALEADRRDRRRGDEGGSRSGS